jgi:predicted small lipoprotein YifL
MFLIGVSCMRRHGLSASLLLFGAGLLAGCGQKGPLFLPKPVAPAPPASTAAPASSVPAPAASVAPASPAPAAGATSLAPARSG